MKKSKIWKKMFPRDWKKTTFTFGIVMLIGASMMGILGLIIALNLLVTMPFAMGVLGMASFSGDVNQTQNGGNIVDRTKQYWNDSSGRRKVGLVGGIGLLLPFIAIAGIWLITMAVGFAIDIVFFVPIIFFIAFLYYRRPSARDTQIGKYLGSPVVGFIGIIGIVFLLVMTSMTFADQNKYNGIIDDMDEFTTPLHVLSGDTEIIALWNETSGQWENQTVARTVDRLIVKIVDPFYDDSGLATTFDNNYTDLTNETWDTYEGTFAIEDTDGCSPIANALVTIACLDKETGTKILTVGKKTNANGQMIWSNVPYGVYDFTVDAGGYYKFNQEFHIDSDWDNGTVIVKMRPIYYKIRVHYEYRINPAYDGGFFVTKHGFAGETTVYPELRGGLEQADWDNIRRQQSWFGWTGLTNAGLMNNIIPVHQSMIGLKNQVFGFMQNILPIVSQAIGSGYSWSNYERDAEALTTPEYFSHSVRVVPEQSYSYSQTESGVGAYDVYSRQIPTPNVIEVKKWDMWDLHVVERYEAFKEFYDFTYSLTGQPLEVDPYQQVIPGSNVTYGDFVDRIDSLGGSISYVRDYDYLVWSTSPDGNIIHLTFNVTTNYVNYESRYTWFGRDITPFAVTVYDTFTFKFSNEIPTEQTSSIG